MGSSVRTKRLKKPVEKAKQMRKKKGCLSPRSQSSAVSLQMLAVRIFIVQIVTLLAVVSSARSEPLKPGECERTPDYTMCAGEPFNVRFFDVDPNPIRSAPPTVRKWMGGGSAHGGGGGGEPAAEKYSQHDRDAIAEGRKILDEPECIQKVYDAIAKVRPQNVILPENALAKAIAQAKRVTASSSIRRNLPPEHTPAGRFITAKTRADVSDATRLPANTDDVKVFVDGKLTDSNEAAGNRNGSLGPVVRHEAIHVLLRFLGFPAELDETVIQQSGCAPATADAHGGPERTANKIDTSEVLPTRNIVGTLEEQARKWLISRFIRNGAVVHEYNSHRVGMFVGATFLEKPRGSSSTPDEEQARAVWSDAFADFATIGEEDFALVQEPDSKPYFVIAGAPVPVPPESALLERGVSLPLVPRQVWAGTQSTLLRAPRDGTVVCETASNSRCSMFIMHGGAALPITPEQLTSLGLTAASKPVLWREALKAFRRPPDGTLYRDDIAFWLAWRGNLVPFASLAAAQHYHGGTLRPLQVWSNALGILYQFPPDWFDLAVDIEEQPTVVTIGSQAVVKFRLTNKGPGAAPGNRSVGLLRGNVTERTTLIAGPIPPGANLTGTFHLGNLSLDASWPGSNKVGVGVFVQDAEPDVDARNNSSMHELRIEPPAGIDAVRVGWQ